MGCVVGCMVGGWVCEGWVVGCTTVVGGVGGSWVNIEECDGWVGIRRRGGRLGEYWACEGWDVL